MIVQTIMLVGEVFQIEVSDGLVHPFWSRQNVNLYPTVVRRVFRPKALYEPNRTGRFSTVLILFNSKCIQTPENSRLSNHHSWIQVYILTTPKGMDETI